MRTIIKWTVLVVVFLASLVLVTWGVPLLTAGIEDVTTRLVVNFGIGALIGYYIIGNGMILLLYVMEDWEDGQ